jgi:hypothetical protein
VIKSPNFFCLGVQKGGTTTLHDILKKHPQIHLSKSKEAIFFSSEKRYMKGKEWWLNHFFSTYNNEPIIGAFTPDYLYFEKVPSRMAEVLGKDLKLIIILRHPVNRAYSHYIMSKRKGFETLSFLEAVETESERVALGEFEQDNFSYFGRSYYVEQIERYFQFFSTENILFLCFEKDIVKNIDQTVLKIQEFLGVEPMKINCDIKSNQATEMRSKIFHECLVKQSIVKSILKKIIPQRTAHHIKEILLGMNQKKLLDNKRLDKKLKDKLYLKHFKSDTPKLENLTGLNLSHWN